MLDSWSDHAIRSLFCSSADRLASVRDVNPFVAEVPQKSHLLVERKEVPVDSIAVSEASDNAPIL